MHGYSTVESLNLAMYMVECSVISTNYCTGTYLIAVLVSNNVYTKKKLHK